MIRSTWFFLGVSLVVVGLLGLALPSSLEGRELLPISPGHAISTMDAVALVPLISGTMVLEVGVWRRRQKLARYFARRPLVCAGLCFGGGMGLGLLLASAFSSFFGWWAIGAAVFGCAMLQTCRLAARDEDWVA